MRIAAEKRAQVGQAGSRTRRARAAVALLLLAAAVASGCGSAIPSSQGGPAKVSADRSAAGTYLVDGEGHALYLFLADGKGHSACTEACASVWPPFETSAPPVAGPGVSQAKLGTISREGVMQVTYAGVPLYYYAGDGSSPDATSGEDIEQFGAPWYLVSPKNAEPAEEASSEGESGGQGHGGGGYGS
ncbi:MAG: COG4315 family predicted lipoprotein [Solirubrobacterales bacterium]